MLGKRPNVYSSNYALPKYQETSGAYGIDRLHSIDRLAYARSERAEHLGHGNRCARGNRWARIWPGEFQNAERQP